MLTVCCLLLILVFGFGFTLCLWIGLMMRVYRYFVYLGFFSFAFMGFVVGRLLLFVLLLLFGVCFCF